MKKYIIFLVLSILPLPVSANTLGEGLPGYSAPSLGGGVPGRYSSQSYYSQSANNNYDRYNNETYNNYPKFKQYNYSNSPYDSNRNYSNDRRNFYGY